MRSSVDWEAVVRSRDEDIPYHDDAGHQQGGVGTGDRFGGLDEDEEGDKGVEGEGGADMKQRADPANGPLTIGLIGESRSVSFFNHG